MGVVYWWVPVVVYDGGCVCGCGVLVVCGGVLVGACGGV